LSRGVDKENENKASFRALSRCAAFRFPDAAAISIRTLRSSCIHTPHPYTTHTHTTHTHLRMGVLTVPYAAGSEPGRAGAVGAAEPGRRRGSSRQGSEGGGGGAGLCVVGDPFMRAVYSREVRFRVARGAPGPPPCPPTGGGTHTAAADDGQGVNAASALMISIPPVRHCQSVHVENTSGKIHPVPGHFWAATPAPACASQGLMGLW
jgi:hypothetical protein